MKANLMNQVKDCITARFIGLLFLTVGLILPMAHMGESNLYWKQQQDYESGLVFLSVSVVCFPLSLVAITRGEDSNYRAIENVSASWHHASRNGGGTYAKREFQPALSGGFENLMKHFGPRLFRMRIYISS